MARLVIEGSDKVRASQLKEFFRQIDEENISGHQLDAFLEHRNPFEEIPFKLLGSFKIGTKSVDKLIQDLKEDYRVTDWAKDMMHQDDFTLANKPADVLLATISVGELGFKKGAEYKEICEKAVGYEIEYEGETYVVDLCPVEVGPQLRLQYKDQPKGELLRIAMKPITDSDGYRALFRVAHANDAQWLNWSSGRPGLFWFAGYRFVFSLRKK